MKYLSTSTAKTIAWAKKHAASLQKGQVIGLIGDLGAGKTQLTKGFALGLGIKKTITSPTFVIMKVYEVISKKPINRLVHIDAYRTSGLNDIVSIGANDYFNDPRTLTVIEWADKLTKNTIKKIKIISINHHPQGRIIIF
jgi:tRNA threonylcarbamoyladenosine biosynthesis protein TsaE